MLDKLIDVAFAFGPFKLIPGRHVLMRDSRPVKLGGRALDILQLLLMRAGEDVSKDDLIGIAWPNIFVDERNLKVHISNLRRALQDTFPQATYIATTVGRGYRFVGPVRVERAEPAEFANDLSPPISGLPALSALIGRQGDVECMVTALHSARLVTLVGPGGVGKTSLAIAVAHAACGEFPDGVHFIDLSAIDGSTLVPHLVATALGARGNPADLIPAVLKHLQDKRILIVLDNCEHVLSGAATIAVRLLGANTGSCILATSREPLGVVSEKLQRVEPLAFPHRAEVRSINEALAYSSVELFALRALETADYRLVDGDAHDVARLCEALDGLPLAIEIATATLDRFSPAELLNSVGRRLSEQRNDDKATPYRHRTLWATLDWSYQLLSPEEATIFRLLSVFAGSFEWTDVAGMARLVQYDPYQTTVALGGLVAKSLLAAEIDGEQLRYRLLESARCYAAEALLQDPLTQDAQRHHAGIVLTAFRKSEEEWAFVDNRVWRSRYEARLGDLRKALDWCFSEEGDASLGANLAISAIRLWNEQSSIFEQLYQVERALNRCTSMTDGPGRMATLATSRAWSMTLARQFHTRTDDAWDTAVRFAEVSGDVGKHLSAICGKATFLTWTGHHEQAITFLNDVIRIAILAGDSASVFDGETLRTLPEVYLGKLLEAQTKLERLAEDLARGMPPSKIARYHLQRHIIIHGNLALVTWLTGRPERALTVAKQLVLNAGQTGQLMGQSTILAFVALPLALWSGQLAVLEEYSTLLRTNLDQANMAIWEPVQQFYASVTRHWLGDLDAIDDMRSAVEELVRDRFVAHTPMYLGVLAEALMKSGQFDDAGEAIELALMMQRQSKELWCLPELLRVKALTIAAIGEHDRACAILNRARESARDIAARSLELRIVNDIAQMAIAEGDNEEAIETLLPVFESFEERTATEDLKRSACLLNAAEDANGLTKLPLVPPFSQTHFPD